MLTLHKLQTQITRLCLIGLMCCLYYSHVNGFANVYGRSKLVVTRNSSQEPLILTSYLKQGKIEYAQTAAEVKLAEFNDLKSYAGFFTVNPQYNSNLFFWFFPARKDYANAPVVVWLQGGPGVSSLNGLFAENGPLDVTHDCRMKLREHSWSEEHSVIYIDSPVGTGFSFTDEGGYAQNQTIVGEQLYEALLQFFQLFPDLQKNPLFITGESYGGKYVPAVSYMIHLNNPSASLKLNLQGLAIGDGWSDPEHHMAYGDYLYQIGLIDFNTKVTLKEKESACIKYIKQKEWTKANYEYNQILYLLQTTSQIHIFDYLSLSDTKNFDDCIGDYLKRDVGNDIHVGTVTYKDFSSIVYKYLSEDFMQPVAPWISELLNHYRILFYNGQLDIIVAYPLTVNFIKNLKFSGADDYKVADRHQWHVDSELAGYVKEAGNLTEVLVRNAGHMVPTKQPRWAQDLITRFTRNQPLY